MLEHVHMHIPYSCLLVYKQPNHPFIPWAQSGYAHCKPPVCLDVISERVDTVNSTVDLTGSVLFKGLAVYFLGGSAGEVLNAGQRISGTPVRKEAAT